MTNTVITMHQPWATLVVLGKKRVETRSWQTNFRGRILIHASKTMSNADIEICQTEPFISALKGVGELPLGSIVGSVNIVTCREIEAVLKGKEERRLFQITNRRYGKQSWLNELLLGNYSPGRFAWLLNDPIAFSNHLETEGRGRIWTMDEQICKSCGCTDFDCDACYEKLGHGCWWVEENLCSACENNQ